MKKTFKTVSALALVLVLLLGLGTAACAESSVTYEGGAEKFVFLEGGDYTATDLFQGLKGVMPGDMLEQKITIKNTVTSVPNVKIYMRALVHDEAGNPLSPNVAAATELASMQDFLSQLSMTVKQGERVLFEASPDQLGGLKDNVLLGTFSGNSSTELTVTLTVPIELGNEYMNRVGEVDWVFTAEEIPATDKPKTGDGSSPALWTLLMALSIITLAPAVFFITKKSQTGR
ncbi:MAG: hypothetical protein HP001_07180 [Oscillospiraceae bacterium]|nr:hypothetical protein [Oscillospiraceae bacterium]